MQKCVYYSAPNTHKTMPRRKTADAMRAAFDPDDSPTKPTRQSVSEQQTPANMLPMHGLNMWQSILTYVTRLEHYMLHHSSVHTGYSCARVLLRRPEAGNGLVRPCREQATRFERVLMVLGRLSLKRCCDSSSSIGSLVYYIWLLHLVVYLREY